MKESEIMAERLRILGEVDPLVGKYFLPLLNKENKSVMAFLSARVGSISDNKVGGWYSYRSSKPK